MKTATPRGSKVWWLRLLHGLSDWRVHARCEDHADL